MGRDSISVVQICSAREAIYGAALSLLTLARAQREAGTSVEFITFAGKRFGDQIRQEGFKAMEIKVRGKIDPFAIVNMRNQILGGKYDIVHTHLSTSSVNGTIAARLARVPSLATVHGMSGKMSFAAADHLIAVSQGVKDHLIKQGVPGRKITVVHNGLDDTFQPKPKEEARRTLGLPPNALIVGTVSRITKLKGIDDALRAVAALSKSFPDLKYLVVGDGDALEQVRQVAAALGVTERVIFAGYQANVAQYLSTMDLFLFPSLKEAMGIALVEAMAAGLPVVSTNVGGIPEVVTPETGVMVGPHCPEALAEAAAAILCDPARHTAMSEAARQRADSVFGPKAMERATDAVYRRMIGRLPREVSAATVLSGAEAPRP